MNEPPESIEEALFKQAIELPTRASRRAFVEQACRGDAALRQTLELLLEGHFQGEGFLTHLPARASSSPQAPRMSGNYHLLEKIGEGGFGEVWRAEQVAPVRRIVAIKILKPGMDSAQIIARFEAERQVLALMDHPNIATVFDAGVTDSGLPYFVMELVHGIRITDYCDQNNLSTRERLDLFIKVCHAVQHAHQKGVIHRDIKPSNILVGPHDGAPVPKVIDFGVAKATEPRLADATAHTQLNLFIGTPAYISPEQADMSRDIDTRSDIYSLGVLLYELLTGATPFGGKELMAAGVDAMRRIIREQEPVRPSTRLATLGAEQQASAAGHRSTVTSRLRHQLIGDLDWIVMKCLEKDRTRRYETANGLAADLRRHLANEPVHARPPSTAYRLQKLLRRNRVVVVSGAAIALALLSATFISSWSFMREKRARISEREQRQNAQASHADATTQRDLAQEHLFDSLLREMRSITTIRRFGYRTELTTRVRQALPMAKTADRVAAIRAEFSQSLGDPIGLEPRAIPWKLAGEGSGPVPMALSSDGRIAALGTAESGLVIHELPSGTRLAQFPMGAPPLLKFSSDGRSLFGFRRVPPEPADPSNPFVFEILTWSTEGSEAWTVRTSRWPRAAAMVANSSGVFTLAPGDDGRTEVRHLDTGRIDARVPRESIRASIVTDYAPRLGFLALGSDYLWSSAINISSVTDPQRRVRLEPAAGMGRFTSARFSPDEQRLLCTAEDGAMVFETTEFREVNRVFGRLGNVFGGVFIQNGAAVALPEGQRASLRMLSLTSGLQTELPTRGIVRHLTANVDGSILMFADDQGVNFVHLTDPRERRRLTGHSGGVTSVEFSPDGRLLVSTGKDGSVRWWNADSGSLHRLMTRPQAVGQGVGFSPDSRWLAVGDFLHDRIDILSVDSGEKLLSLGDGKPGRTWVCAFSPDGRRLFAHGDVLRAWEFTTNFNAPGDMGMKTRLILEEKQTGVGKRVQSNSGGGGVGKNLQFHPSGKWVAVSGSTSRDSGRVFLRRLDSPGASETVAEVTSGQSQTIGFVPRGIELAYVSAERRELHFVDPANGRATRKLPLLLPGERATTPIANVCFRPDGARVASVNGNGRSVDIVDVASGRRLYALPDERGVVWWLAWHPDGRRLAVARENGDLSLWNLTEVEAALDASGLAP